MARGRGRKKLIRKASKARKRMIARNRWHPEDLLPKVRKEKFSLPEQYKKIFNRVAKSASGKKALRRYKSFWGLPYPTHIKTLDIGPKNKVEFLVGMGRTPNVLLADGPEGRHKKIRKIKGRFTVATNKSGNRIYILRSNPKSIGKNLKFVGFAPQTHYIPTNAQEHAGTFKKGKYWIHEHGKSERGKWPKVYKDSAGNFIYAKGTYNVGKWIQH